MTADVLIAGAGPAGAVAACVLARAGRRVVMVDDGEPARAKIGESLPGAARPLLRDLGLSPILDDGRHAPCYGTVSSWGSADLVPTDSIRDPHGPGWHLDRSRFDADLRAAARDAGVECRAARVTSATRTADRWSVTLSDGERDAAWLIDATGRRAVLARRQGSRRRRDDRLVALSAWAATGDAETRTLVESTPDGWWYTARVPGQARVAVLHVDAEEAAAIHRVPGAWDDRLARTTHVRGVLEGARWLSAPRAEDAGGARLERFTGTGWLAVGDAALSFDPLSSQGIFNALYTGMKAGMGVDAALSGQSGAIEAYAARLESIRAAYLGHWRTYYGAERRWPDRRFWARRHLGDR